MNTRQLQYAVMLAKHRNFSHVAEMLHITQPALSKQILNLEKELDIKLFDRNSIPLKLTAAGDHFIKEAEQLLYREGQLIRSMAQYKTGKKGRLEIGISPFRNLHLMPSIISKVKQEYTGIQVILHEAGSDQLRKDAAEGKYDFAIVNLPVDDSVLDIIPLEPEHLILAIPQSLASTLPLSGNPEVPEIDIAECGQLPFIVVAQPQEMRQYFDKLCAASGYTPNISIEVVGGITTAWSMARAGLGATLLPSQFVSSNTFSENLILAKIKNTDFIRQPVIVVKKDQYISEYTNYAIQLLKETCSKPN